MRSLDDTLRHLLPWDTGIELVIDEPVDEYEEEQSGHLRPKDRVLNGNHYVMLFIVFYFIMNQESEI